MTVVSTLDLAIERLELAAESGVPCDPVRELIGADDIVTAYLVQRTLISRRTDRGATRVGRKIGLTSPSVQRQLGVDQPDVGVLLDEMAIPDGGVVPIARVLQPKVEGEIAFVLGADLHGVVDRETVRAAVVSAHACIEIVDSRIGGWDIGITDTVADNASSGLFVVSDRGFPLDEVEPVDVAMTLRLNGEEVSHGTGRASLGDPLRALEWLARTAADFDDPLRAGELVLSGALGPMVSVQAGDHVQVVMTDLGEVSASFERSAT